MSLTSGGEAGRVAVAKDGDVQGAFLGAESGDELSGEVNLAGVGGLVAGGAFQQFQQRQAGEGVGRVRRSGRTGQLFGGEVCQQGAKAAVGGFLVLQLLAKVLLPAGEGGQHLHLATGDLLQRVDVTLGVEVKQDVADRPALAEEGFLGFHPLE